MAYINEKLNEFNKYLSGRKVAIIGLGVSNIPLIDYLHEYKAKVTVFDNRNIDDIDRSVINKITDYGMEFSFGINNLSKLNGFELIFRSPSCLPTTPELVEEAKKGAIVTTEVELVIEMTPSTVIGITGSDGKTTTTSLIAKIIEAGGYKCFLGGNIGTPLFTQIKDMMPEDIVVLELSSFQLMKMTVSPHIAVVTNVTPNHLDYHKDLEEYIDAKKTIIKHQDKDGLLVLNYDNDVTRSFAKDANCKVIFFSDKEKLDDGYIVDEDKIKFCENKLRRHIMDTEEAALIGKHNYQNICAALAATSTLVSEEKAVEVIKKFVGVHHRLELVKTDSEGNKWYNDSASTTPSRTMSGLASFKKKVILIAGGADKNLDYSVIGDPIVEKCKSLVLMGTTKEKIKKAVEDSLNRQNKKLKIQIAQNLDQAIELAKGECMQNDIVLFSPASTSFDMFKNAYQRGDLFREKVNNSIK